MLSDHNTLYKEIGTVPNNTPADYKDLDECSWLKEVDSLALSNIQINQDNAFKAFFKGTSSYPKFKKKHSSKQSYTTNCVNGNIKLIENHLTLPKLKNPISLRLHQSIKPGGKLKSVTVSREYFGKYYFSLLYEYPKEELEYAINTENSIGLDMSIPKLYVDNNGNSPEFPHPHRKVEKRIALEQRKLSRMKKDSNNYKKQRQRINQLYSRSKNQRKDFLHKLSRELVDKYDLICVEDLNLAAIRRTFHFGKAVNDNGWNMFVTFMTYKAERQGKKVIKVSRFFPSTKKCHTCGYLHKEIKLSDRIYECPVCWSIMDRDQHSAVNIRAEGIRIYKESVAA